MGLHSTVWGTAGIVWTEAKQKAATREMTIQYGSKWIGHTVADCSGIFSWAFKQLGGYMYHGSNTMYKSYCTSKGQLKAGKRTDSMALLPGTAVFTGTEGNHGHVGLYIGNGTVIEAQGTKAGVITSKVTDKKWTFWGELKGVQYDGAEPEPYNPDADLPTLRKGDKGSYVSLLQAKLLNRGYNLGKWGADGSFGNATETAVKAFQTDSGLAVDGIVGKLTWAALDSAEPTEKWTVHIPDLSEVAADAMLSAHPGSWKDATKG